MSTSKRTRAPSTSSPCTPGSFAETVGGARDLGDDRGARHAPQLLQRAALLRPAGADDAHPVAERFDLGEDVARQQHGPSLGLDLADAVLEDRLHQRVEARRRLVEDEQLGARRERRHETDLLTVALRVGARLLGRVELEALEQLVATSRVEVAAQPAEQIDDLAAAQLRPERHVAGHVREPPVQRDRVAPRVAAEQPHARRGRRAAARAAPGSSSSCPNRSVRGSRAPRPSRRRDRDRRAPSSTRTS